MRLLSFLIFFGFSYLNAQITIDVLPDIGIANCQMGVSPLNNSQYIAWRDNNGGGSASSACGTINNPWAIVNENITEEGCGQAQIETEWSITDDCNSSAIGIIRVFYIISDRPEWTTYPSDITIDCGSPNAQSEVDNWIANNGNGIFGDDCTPTSDLIVTTSYNGGLPQCDNDFHFQFEVRDTCFNSDHASVSITSQATRIDFITNSIAVSEEVGAIQICFEALNANLDADATIELEVESYSSATVGQDYQAFNLTTIFPAGPVNSTHCFDIVIIDDNVIDDSYREHIFLSVTNISSPVNEVSNESTSNDLQIEITDNDDLDRDGIHNSQDNCPNMSNSGQEDLDGDGIGNVCDPSTEVTQLHEVKDNIYANKTYSGVIVKSPDGNCWMMTVRNNGQVDAVSVVCP
ncbi:hypothetical protein N9L92_02420 [Saprospiraceae bacterium]|nr:hypothetical protein [Saprospiraceae bacterium]